VLNNEYEKEKFLLENSFCYFFEKAWDIIEPGTPLKKSWHISAVAKHLEALAKGEITRLIINLPPRLGKSNLSTVAFPAWLWTKNPSLKILSASCTRNLALTHSEASRELIKSSWYQKYWNIELSKSNDSKSNFQNTEKGKRLSVSAKSTNIGFGGDILIIDDPNEPNAGKSRSAIDDVLFWYSKRFVTRLNPGGKILLIQQRIHEEDLTGFILSKKKEDWVHLRLPALYEPFKHTKTILLDKYDPKLKKVVKKVWEDPRKEENEPIVTHFDNDFIRSMKSYLGSYDFAGQFQQSPAPAEGGILKKKWFRVYTKEHYPDFQDVIQSWDTAISDSPNAAYSACTTWGIFLDRYNNLNFMLLGLWRGRVGFPELRDRAKRLFKNYKDTKTEPLKNKAPYSVSRCIVEAKATGDPLIRDLKLAGINAIGFIPKGDKTSRVQLVAPLIESGVIHLPSYKIDDPSELAEHAEIFLKEMISFPNAESRDLVDTLTQVLHYYKPHNKNDEKVETYAERHYNNINPVLQRFFE